MRSTWDADGTGPDEPAARVRAVAFHRPSAPVDRAFYDHRLPDARAAQAELAAAYGIEAFCSWYHWSGRGIVDVPVSGDGLGFCLGWANRADPRYGPDHDRAHFAAVLPAFRDPRHLRVDGRPVFYIGRPERLPDAAGFVDRWQELARAAGLDGLYLVAEVSDLLGHGPVYDALEADGFDAGVHLRLPAHTDRRPRLGLRRRPGRPAAYPYAVDPRLWDPVGRNKRLQPGVIPNWDTSHSPGGLALTGASPDRFEQNVRHAVDRLHGRHDDERLLWIRSWNAWAEGNHLEPDLERGHGWLEALQRGMGDLAAGTVCW